MHVSLHYYYYYYYYYYHYTHFVYTNYTRVDKFEIYSQFIDIRNNFKRKVQNVLEKKCFVDASIDLLITKDFCVF